MSETYSPTATWWPTKSPYPTASGTPTSSPFPTKSLFPTNSQIPTISSSPVEEAIAPSPVQVPTQPDPPNLLAFEHDPPTIVEVEHDPPTIVESDSKNAQGRGNGVVPSAEPSSIVHVMVEQFIQEGIDEAAATEEESYATTPTASPYPTASPAPTETGAPSSSPFPTASATPTSSPFPTDSLSPTASGTPTSSPFPTASSTPTQSPFPTEETTTTATTTMTTTTTTTGVNTAMGDRTNSVGYGRQCSNYSPGTASEEKDVNLVFTYIAESKTTSVDFLTDLEEHILDHAAAESLECAQDSSLHIYKLQYPDDSQASEATTCEPQHPESTGCWVLQTQMACTTEESSSSVAKFTVLAEIQKQLDDGNLMTTAFPDLTFTKYLGPDPVESTFEKAINTDTTTTTTTSTGQPPMHSSVFWMATLAAGLAIMSTLVFLSLLFYIRHKRQNGDAESESDSIETVELLDRSRRRLKELPTAGDDEVEDERQFAKPRSKMMSSSSSSSKLKRHSKDVSYKTVRQDNHHEQERQSRPSSSSRRFVRPSSQRHTTSRFDNDDDYDDDNNSGGKPWRDNSSQDADAPYWDAADSFDDEWREQRRNDRSRSSQHTRPSSSSTSSSSRKSSSHDETRRESSSRNSSNSTQSSRREPPTERSNERRVFRDQYQRGSRVKGSRYDRVNRNDIV